MTSTLIDSNVLIDVLESPDDLEAWSHKQVKEAGDFGPVLVNPIIMAELAAGFENVRDLDRFLRAVEISREPVPWTAAFQAGKAHALYRRRGGMRERTLPDFLIGAHAMMRDHQLLTRDASRYRSYFPTLSVIAPDTHP